MDFIRRLGSDRRGVAAVEFAIIAPVMLVMYLGLAEFTQAMMAERRTIRIASAIGDMIAQNSEISPTGTGGISDVLDIANTLMRPYPTGTALKLCVASIVSDANGKEKVEWSRNENDSTCPAKGSTVSTLSGDLISANQSLIMSRVTYDYSGTLTETLKTNPTFTKTLYLRPRRSSKVVCEDC
jgi:Flp pilus assembly protein TadG